MLCFSGNIPPDFWNERGFKFMADFLNTAFAGFDAALLSAMHTLARAAGGVLTPVMRIITLLGEKGLLFLLAAVVLALFPRTRKTGVCLFGAIACGFLLGNLVLKELVARPRPFESSELFRSFWEFIGSPAESGFSFPSGHTTAAAAGFLALVLERGRRFILPGCVWVVLMGLSRTYLMAHYPTDVLAGLLVGCLSAVIAWLIAGQIFRALRRRKKQPLCRFLLYYDPLRVGRLRNARH